MSAEAVALASASGARKRAAAYLELTKPRVLAMVLLTTLVGFYLGSAERFDLWLALNTLFGTALAAGGTLALNQYFERRIDALMIRTQHRPLPEGRLSPPEALVFGLVATVARMRLAVGGDEFSGRRGDRRDRAALPVRVYAAQAGLVDLPCRRRGARSAAAGCGMGRGQREARPRAFHPVPHHVPVAASAFALDCAALPERLRARRNQHAAACGRTR